MSSKLEEYQKKISANNDGQKLNTLLSLNGGQFESMNGEMINEF